MGNSKTIKMWLEGGTHLDCTFKKVKCESGDFTNMAYMKYEGTTFGLVDFNTYKLVPRKDFMDEATPWYYLVKR